MAWIYAEEMLPEEREKVLVYTEHDMFGREHYKRSDITIGEYDYISDKWKVSQFLGNRVIAWMLMPEPPKGE